jgi:hypothetical protein
VAAVREERVDLIKRLNHSGNRLLNLGRWIQYFGFHGGQLVAVGLFF